MRVFTANLRPLLLEKTAEDGNTEALRRGIFGETRDVGGFGGAGRVAWGGG